MRGGDVKLDQSTIEWVQKAIDATPYGEVTLVIHDGSVVKVRTNCQRPSLRFRDSVHHVSR